MTTSHQATSTAFLDNGFKKLHAMNLFQKARCKCVQIYSRKRYLCGSIFVSNHRGGSRIFFRRGCTRLFLYFNTNKPHSFFLQNTSCIKKPQVISGGGGEGAHPLHPSPRSAPEPPPVSESTTNSSHFGWSLIHVKFDCSWKKAPV